MSLSSKGIEGHSCYFKDDVKEFIRLLKEEMPKHWHEIIDALAGEALL